ncbi:hypothetical protein KAS06_01300 [Candidatus Bathyarchaeota archaeon]|nr:hypothetical protein [Candidatus Bathyarchaeota archaeon]
MDELDTKDLELIKKEIYDTTIKLRGTITVEHGAGKIRINDFCQHLDEKTIKIMKIKKFFFGETNDLLYPETIGL